MLFGVAVHGRQVFAAGQHLICSSGDGGATWSRFEAPGSVHLMEVACSDARHAWAVGAQSTAGDYRAVVFATSDSGRTWMRQSVPGVADLASVSFVDARHGWAVGGDITRPEGDIVVTSDGGAHWSASEARKQLYKLLDDGWAVARARADHRQASATGARPGTTGAPCRRRAPRLVPGIHDVRHGGAVEDGR